jgi:hypothetical protein
MSIRKRTWKTARGEAKEAWVVDYTDQGGKRRLKTFKKKKEAETKAQFEITQGAHPGLGQNHGCGGRGEMA